MRGVHRNVLLALLAFSSVASVAAIPSPTTLFDQEPLGVPTAADDNDEIFSRAPSRWRAWSGKLIETIWGAAPGTECGGGKERATAPPSSWHTYARYDGDVVLRFNVSTTHEAGSLAAAADRLLLDVWRFARGWVDVRVAARRVPALLDLLPPTLRRSHAPLLPERRLAQAVHETYPRRRPAAGGGGDVFFNDYQPLAVLQPWMRLLASLFSTHVRLVHVGTSYEGREILGLRVGVHPTNDADPDPPRRKTVLVTGGLHAREWIGTSTVSYVAHHIITEYGRSLPITRLLEQFDFIFLPTVNPDGYAYTWETDRLWRKNRQPTDVRFCQGVDLDRAFGFEWGGGGGVGGGGGGGVGGGNPCSESFAGAEPFAAVESRRLAEWARNETRQNNVEFVGFLDLHSYSQQILYPYSYSCDSAPPGRENLEELALGLAKAIRISSGHHYEVLAACEGNIAASSSSSSSSVEGAAATAVIEPAGGSALDWFYHELHVRYAYQLKLRDRGSYGFLLPREHIVPTGRETLDAVLYFASFLRDLYAAEGGSGAVEMTRPDLDHSDERPAPFVRGDGEVVDETEEEEDDDDDDDDGWVMVTDGEPQWELRRRRKR